MIEPPDLNSLMMVPAVVLAGVASLARASSHEDTGT